MPMTNIIVNGIFDQGSTGWTGVDLETSYDENTYLQDGSSNRVAEMDGNAGQTTVMKQSFTLSSAGTFTLSLDSAIRSDMPDQTLMSEEGFWVEVVDASGNVVFSQEILPDSTSWQSYSFDVTFPDSGTYTLRLTEVGPDQSYGAIVDNISLLVCFAAGTLISTDRGERPVETLALGDLVLTEDAGFQPLRWIGRRLVTVAEQQADATLRPVVFAPGSLGKGLPRRALAVSPQHRMAISDWRCQLYFAESEVLASAISLVNGDSIRQAEPEADVTYVHFLLDGHQIVRAEGAPSESFYPTAWSLNGVDAAARQELLRLFPEIEVQPPGMTARPVIQRLMARLVA